MVIIKTKIFIITAILALVLSAITVNAESNTYYLTHSNVPALEGTQVKVTVDESSNIISVELVSATVTNTPKGIHQFFYNLQVDEKTTPKTGNYILNNNAGWVEQNLNYGGTQGASFGNFASHKSEGTAAKSIDFTLNGPFKAPINPNDHGSTIAVHLQFDDDCSGWLSDGTPDSFDSGGNCRAINIPEFPTIALPVAGMLALMFIIHGRKKKE